MSLADRDAKIRVPAHTRHAGIGVVEGVRAYRTAGGRTSIRVPYDRHRRTARSRKSCSRRFSISCRAKANGTRTDHENLSARPARTPPIAP